jgi:multidrug efflux pump subunit AcrB
MYKVRKSYQKTLTRLLFIRPVVFTIFVVLATSSLLIYPMLGRELFPAGNPSTFQLRIKAITGTRFEKTEVIAKKILDYIAKQAADDNVEISIGYVGTQPPSYAISNVYMWTAGPEEAILMVQLKESAKINMADFEERLRKTLAKEMPTVNINFEAGDIVNKIINLGSPTPIQVDVAGPNFEKDQEYTQKLLAEMKKISYLRDVGIVQPLDYPTVRVNVDRIRAGQLNATVHEIGRAIIAATYSSRFVSPIYWVDSRNGLAYQVQVQVPQGDINSIASLGAVRVKGGDIQGPYVRDVAEVHYGVMPGEYDHYNMKRMVSIAANIGGDDLGKAAELVNSAIKRAGDPPRGVKVNVRGQVPVMQSTFFSFQLGVCFAIVAIFLMLVAFFQAVRLSLIIISVVPTILAGALWALFITHTTLNVQSFMGAIMAVGVGVANSILVVVFAEERRMTGLSAKTAAVTGAAARLRPVLMTSIAMISGMVPMALGMSEGGDRTAPLGRAVIGGLLVSTSAVLLVLPLIYATAQRKANRKGASVLPKRVEEKLVH